MKRVQGIARNIKWEDTGIRGNRKLLKFDIEQQDENQYTLGHVKGEYLSTSDSGIISEGDKVEVVGNLHNNEKLFVAAIANFRTKKISKNRLSLMPKNQYALAALLFSLSVALGWVATRQTSLISEITKIIFGKEYYALIMLDNPNVLSFPVFLITFLSTFILGTAIISISSILVWKPGSFLSRNIFRLWNKKHRALAVSLTIAQFLLLTAASKFVSNSMFKLFEKLETSIENHSTTVEISEENKLFDNAYIPDE